MIKTIFLHLDNLSNFPGLMNLYDISRIQALRHLAVESYKRFLKLSFLTFWIWISMVSHSPRTMLFAWRE